MNDDSPDIGPPFHPNCRSRYSGDFHAFMADWNRRQDAKQMDRYLRFVRTVLPVAEVRVRADGTLLYRFGGVVHEWGAPQ